jgi:hypothetical protein
MTHQNHGHTTGTKLARLEKIQSKFDCLIVQFDTPNDTLCVPEKITGTLVAHLRSHSFCHFVSLCLTAAFLSFAAALTAYSLTTNSFTLISSIL